MGNALATIKQGYQIMGMEARDKVVANRANIFTGLSVVGTIGTAVVSAFAGAKSARQIDAKAAELQRPLTTKEKAKLCWKNFLGPAATVVGSSAGAIGSNRVMAGDIARLTADVTMVQKAYNEFRKASNEVLTEKQQEEVRDKIAENKMAEIPQKEIDRVQDIPGGGYGVTQLFVDGFNPEVKFFSTVDKVELAMAELRNEMALLPARNKQGYSPVILGIPYVNWLYKIGWVDPTTAFKTDSIIFKKYGWNKGYPEEDGTSNDDEISAYLKPGETMWQGQRRSCYYIEWDQAPSDMELGNLIKSDIV